MYLHGLYWTASIMKWCTQIIVKQKAHDRQFNGLLDAHIRDHTRTIDNLRICVILWLCNSFDYLLPLFSSSLHLSFSLSLSHLWRFVLIIISWQGLYDIQVIAVNKLVLPRNFPCVLLSRGKHLCLFQVHLVEMCDAKIAEIVYNELFVPNEVWCIQIRA